MQNILWKKKSRNTRSALKKTKIIDYGRLSSRTWPGPVRASVVRHRLGVDQQRIENVVHHIDEYYVMARTQSGTRCIDGRVSANYDATKLGAQVPGGAPGAAIAYRLAVDKDDLTRGSFLADAESMIDQFLRLGHAPGGHRDQSANDNHAGCGAIDRMDMMLAAMINPAHVDEHKRLTKLILGDMFSRDEYLRVLGAANVISAHASEYFRNRDDILDVLEKMSPGSVEVLLGEHSECLFVVNHVEGTTLDTKRVSDENAGVQVFGYDIWVTERMATRLLPLESQDIDRQRYVMARVMCAVATLIVLTDGSQRFLVRTHPEAESFRGISL